MSEAPARAICGFHTDAEGHWVAELVCGHNQHVRHDPPWQNRPWVTEAAGRRAALGQALACRKCLQHLPRDWPGSPGQGRVHTRDEREDDAAAIAVLVEAAFWDAPHRGGNEARIVAALRAAGQLSASRLVVAEDEQLLGHVALSPVRLSEGRDAWFGLGPLAVRPGWQRQGLGARLVGEALQALRQRGAAGCVLVGDPAYYGRFGFRAEPGLRCPGLPAEVFLALPLDGPVPAATVRYADAFFRP